MLFHLICFLTTEAFISIPLKFSVRTLFMNNLPVSGSRFSYPLSTLQQIAKDILMHARKGGATACETNVSDGFGQTVTVRRSAVETIEYNRDKGLSVTVYIGQKRGHAS